MNGLNLLFIAIRRSKYRRISCLDWKRVQNERRKPALKFHSKCNFFFLSNAILSFFHILYHRMLLSLIYQKQGLKLILMSQTD